MVRRASIFRSCPNVALVIGKVDTLLTMDDAEEQSMELEAVKSIYGEDAIIKASSQAYSLELSVELDERGTH